MLARLDARMDRMYQTVKDHEDCAKEMLDEITLRDSFMRRKIFALQLHPGGAYSKIRWRTLCAYATIRAGEIMSLQTGKLEVAHHGDALYDAGFFRDENKDPGIFSRFYGFEWHEVLEMSRSRRCSEWLLAVDCFGTLNLRTDRTLSSSCHDDFHRFVAASRADWLKNPTTSKSPELRESYRLFMGRFKSEYYWAKPTDTAGLTLPN